MKRVLAMLAAVALAATAAATAGGGQGSGCCAGCGSHSGLQKVCRRVCEFKEVKKTYYCEKEEDFCVPGRSEESCGKEIPTSSEIRTKKHLTKKVVVEKVPVYKLKVEYVCPSCAAGRPAEVDAPTPAAPVAGGTELDPPARPEPVRSASARVR